MLLIAVFNSQALTLGRMRGVALVGQGLDVTIPIQGDAGDGAASLCIEADVFHADAKQEPGRVQISVEPAPAAQAFNVRIVSSSVIDEPVVTVYLRAGCGQQASRRYVLLADVLTEQAVAPVARVAQVPLIVPAAAADRTQEASRTRSTGVGSGAGAITRKARASSASRSHAAGAADRQADMRAVAKRPASIAAARKAIRPKDPAAAIPSMPADEKLLAGRSAGQSRLKLDPIEVLSERVAMLESSTAGAPAELAARETSDAQRLQALEASVKNLLAAASRNEASLLDLKSRVQQAESERYLNPVVYGLIALLLASLAGIALLLARGRRQARASGGIWWGGMEQQAPKAAPSQAAPGSPRPSGFTPVSAPTVLSGPDSTPGVDLRPHPQGRGAGPRSVPGPVTQADVSLVEMSESTFDRLMQSGATHSAVRKPRVPEPGQPVSGAGGKLKSSDELIDVRQQAEFFVSLGQTDEAVRVLENRIGESGESSPLAYLDLLKIFHSLGLRDDFRQVREDFGLLFNARIPEFSGFSDEGKGLEEYPDVIASLVDVWGTPGVFAVIENCVFRDETHAPRELLDLAAFRDLLLLHAVALAVNAADNTHSTMAGSVPDRPAMGRLGAIGGPGIGAHGRAIARNLSGVSAGVPLPTIDGLPDLDIDLSDLHISMPMPLAARDVDIELESSSDAGNMIDFDLPDPLPKDAAR